MATAAKHREITQEEKESAEAEIVEQSKRIEFYMTEYSVEILAQKVQDGEFIVPPYQREFTWEQDRKSRFIESVLMGLPIPFLFFWEMPDGKLEIVDGSQRLRTLEEFVLGDLKLSELQALPKISGFRFSDLPDSRQRKIKNRSIRGIVLNEHADEQARFDMFERINTGSKAANTAEVRRGALAGPFMSMVIELAEAPELVELAPVSAAQIKEREREELVTRFFAYGDGLDGYKDRPSEFIFGYTKKMNESFEKDPALADAYKARFFETLSFVKSVFPFGFRKAKSGKATPRSRFEAIAIGSYMALQSAPQIVMQPPDVEHWLNETDFAKITGSDGANAVSRLKRRMEYVRDRLLGK
ncbi:DUF262 domain-containing protein [Rhodanobacter sp. MP1X3]|uniref:DUF262 domain-containing protein n=1 Tax=Rhodanobacter sp. MP1X3 TaxID=2723086 RepID=UPI0016220891|nr:DUF262 domain-containing protein [Rhodanobacter sp. MP1X3]MBB6242413.1 hypothetical protein [Rhodanobacter sp. MP1X3]